MVVMSNDELRRRIFLKKQLITLTVAEVEAMEKELARKEGLKDGK